MAKGRMTDYASAMLGLDEALYDQALADTPEMEGYSNWYPDPGRYTVEIADGSMLKPPKKNGKIDYPVFDLSLRIVNADPRFSEVVGYEFTVPHFLKLKKNEETGKPVIWGARRLKILYKLLYPDQGEPKGLAKMCEIIGGAIGAQLTVEVKHDENTQDPDRPFVNYDWIELVKKPE